MLVRILRKKDNKINQKPRESDIILVKVFCVTNFLFNETTQKVNWIIRISQHTLTSLFLLSNTMSSWFERLQYNTIQCFYSANVFIFNRKNSTINKCYCRRIVQRRLWLVHNLFASNRSNTFSRCDRCSPIEMFENQLGRPASLSVNIQ